VTPATTCADIQGSENPDLGPEVLQSSDHHKFLHQFDDKLDGDEFGAESPAEIGNSDTPAVTDAEIHAQSSDKIFEDQDTKTTNSTHLAAPQSPSMMPKADYASSEGSPQLAFTTDSAPASPAQQIQDEDTDHDTDDEISLSISPVAERTRSSRRESSMLAPACMPSVAEVPPPLMEVEAEAEAQDAHAEEQCATHEVEAALATSLPQPDCAVVDAPRAQLAAAPLPAVIEAVTAVTSSVQGPQQVSSPASAACPAKQVSPIKAPKAGAKPLRLARAQEKPSKARRVAPVTAKEATTTKPRPVVSAAVRARSQAKRHGDSTKSTGNPAAAGRLDKSTSSSKSGSAGIPAHKAQVRTTRAHTAPRVPTAAEVQAKAEAAVRISSTTKELQEIQAARKELARRRAANARRMAAMKAAPGTTAPRAASKPKAAAAPAVAAVAPPGVPSAHRKPTAAQPFSFAYDARMATRKASGPEDDAAEGATSPFVGMAEGMAKWLAQDKPRFHSKSARELAKGPSPIKDTARHGPTSPHPFHFATDDVVPQHGGKALSTAQEEEAYLAALKPFKATPYNPAAANVSTHMAPVERRPLTTPMSPALRTDRRLGKKMPAAESNPSPVKVAFKARPVPQSVMSGSVAMSGATLHRTAATIPVSPPLRTRARADTRPPAAPQAEPHISPFKAAEMPDYAEISAACAPVEHKPPTVAQPFHLRTDERHMQSAAALEASQAQLHAEEERARHFKARAVGEGVDRGVFVAAPSVPRQPTRSQPFALSQSSRPSLATATEPVSQTKSFKARPVPVSVRAPVHTQVKRAPRRTAAVAAKPLASDARAEKRAAYEAAKAKREAQRAARQAEADAAKAAADADALKALRKAAEFKARPVGAGVPALRLAGHLQPRRAPTIPVSPKLGPVAKRALRSARGGPGRVPLQSAENLTTA